MGPANPDQMGSGAFMTLFHFAGPPSIAILGLIPIVRIPDPQDGTSARRALEAGAETVIVPMVRSAADVRGIIEALTFPPEGKRGLCPGLRVPGYSVTEFNQYMRDNNANLYVVPMVETVDALENVEEICAIEQVKALVFASGELSFAMGEGAAGDSSPKIQEAQRKVHAVAVPRVGGIGIFVGAMIAVLLWMSPAPWRFWPWAQPMPMKN